jgi:ketosteroid isomerase-like protein
MDLPKVLTDYFAAANAGDADRAATCFAEDAVINDERRTMQGRAAIRAWAEETQRKYRYRAEVVKVETKADQIVVTVHLTGSFPGSPIDLRYRFKLAGQQINALEIG